MDTNDYFYKKKFTLKRFAVEFIIFIFLVLCILAFFKNFNYLFFTLIFFLIYLVFGFFYNKLLLPIQFLFNQIFFIISKITNPALLSICYLIGIFPLGIFYKFFSFFKRKQKNEWIDCDISVKTIDLNEQF